MKRLLASLGLIGMIIWSGPSAFAYQSELLLQPNNKDILNRARAAVSLGDYANAVALFQAAKQYGASSHQQACRDLAATYCALDRYSDAENELKEYRALNPFDDSALVDLGNVYMRHGLFSEAASAYSEYLEDHANDTNIKFLAATAFEKEGSLNSAREYYQQVCDMGGGTTRHLAMERLNQLKETLLATNSKSSTIAVPKADTSNWAEQSFQSTTFAIPSSAQPQPGSLQSGLQLAVFDYSNGDYDAALASLHKLDRQYPDNAQVHYLLGACQTKERNYEAADKEYRKVLDLHPDAKLFRLAESGMQRVNTHVGLALTDHGQVH